MAEEEKKEGEENDEKKEEPKAAGKGKLFLIIGGVVALIALAGVGAFFALKSNEPSTEVVGSGSAEHTDEILPEGHNDEDEFDEGEEPLGAMYPLDAFVVNLAGGGFIRVQVTTEFVEREVPKRFYVRLTPIKDALISLFASKRKEDIVSKDGKDELRTEIKDSINDVLKKEEVRKVYFTQFVVQ